MNWNVGLFRLWLVLTAAWLLLSGVIFYQPIKEAIDQAQLAPVPTVRNDPWAQFKPAPQHQGRPSSPPLPSWMATAIPVDPAPAATSGSSALPPLPDGFQLQGQTAPAQGAVMRVQGPNGIVVEFPAGTDDATIDRVMRQATGGSSPSTREGAPHGGASGALTFDDLIPQKSPTLVPVDHDPFAAVPNAAAAALRAAAFAIIPPLALGILGVLVFWIVAGFKTKPRIQSE
jgi:hypothetical protein